MEEGLTKRVQKMRTHLSHFALIAILPALFCGCKEEKVRTEITALREIGKLAVYKVQNADLLTGKDNDVEVQYIAYTDALICVDFAEVKIDLVDEEAHKYEVRFPDFTVEQARVIHDEKYSRPWSAKIRRGRSSTRVDNQLKIAAERAIETEARKTEHMERAVDQAKSVVETMIRAADKDATFSYL